jgi:hypothetical protein
MAAETPAVIITAAASQVGGIRKRTSDAKAAKADERGEHASAMATAAGGSPGAMHLCPSPNPVPSDPAAACPRHTEQGATAVARKDNTLDVAGARPKAASAAPVAPTTLRPSPAAVPAILPVPSATGDGAGTATKPAEASHLPGRTILVGNGSARMTIEQLLAAAPATLPVPSATGDGAGTAAKPAEASGLPERTILVGDGLSTADSIKQLLLEMTGGIDNSPSPIRLLDLNKGVREASIVELNRTTDKVDARFGCKGFAALVTLLEHLIKPEQAVIAGIHVLERMLACAYSDPRILAQIMEAVKRDMSLYVPDNLHANAAVLAFLLPCAVMIEGLEVDIIVAIEKATKIFASDVVPIGGNKFYPYPLTFKTDSSKAVAKGGGYVPFARHYNIPGNTNLLECLVSARQNANFTSSGVANYLIRELTTHYGFSPVVLVSSLRVVSLKEGQHDALPDDPRHQAGRQARRHPPRKPREIQHPRVLQGH